MRIKHAAVSFVMVGLLSVSVPLFAHHGYASYDTDRKVTLKGTVTRWIWSNPHCLLQLDVTDESGHVAHCAHLGGILTGFLFARQTMRRHPVPTIAAVEAKSSLNTIPAPD